MNWNIHVFYAMHFGGVFHLGPFELFQSFAFFISSSTNISRNDMCNCVLCMLWRVFKNSFTLLRLKKSLTEWKISPWSFHFANEIVGINYNFFAMCRSCVVKKGASSSSGMRGEIWLAVLLCWCLCPWCIWRLRIPVSWSCKVESESLSIGWPER